jgi:hypothetical protein
MRHGGCPGWRAGYSGIEVPASPVTTRRNHAGRLPAMTDQPTNACTLISASCTTGWRDWIHSELWLCPEGLLRRRLGLWKTIRHGNMRGAQPTVDPENRQTRSFSLDELRQTASNPRDMWIRWEDVAKATLKSGLMAHSVQLELKDDAQVKFLWSPLDYGVDEMRDGLSRALGSRFTAA